MIVRRPFSLVTWAKILLEAGRYIGMLSGNSRADPLNWFPYRDLKGQEQPDQVWFIQNWLRGITQALPEIPELEWIFNRKAEPINQWLENRRMDIKLDAWPLDQRFFGVAAYALYGGDWYQDGVEWGYNSRTCQTEKYLTKNGRPAFRLDLGEAKIRLWDVGYTQDPLVSVPTKEGDMISFVVTDRERELEGPGLFELAATFMTDRASCRFGSWDSVIFPNFNRNRRVPSSWLLGMNLPDPTDGVPWVLWQAVAQIVFGVGPKGFAAADAAAAGFAKEACMPAGEKPYRGLVDGSSVVWLERSGIDCPLIVDYLTPKDFSETVVDIDALRKKLAPKR